MNAPCQGFILPHLHDILQDGEVHSVWIGPDVVEQGEHVLIAGWEDMLAIKKLPS